MVKNCGRNYLCQAEFSEKFNHVQWYSNSSQKYNYIQLCQKLDKLVKFTHFGCRMLEVRGRLDC